MPSPRSKPDPPQSATGIPSMRVTPKLVLPMLLLSAPLLLSACAGERWTYSAPGVDQKTVDADRSACEEESGITRLGDDQKALAQQCMMTRGYTMKKVQ
jgi:hypothetical protein